MAARLPLVAGAGPRSRRGIVSFFADERSRALVNRLKEFGLQMELAQEEQEGESDLLKDKIIVISGVFNHHSRDEYKALIERHGGKNSGSISAKTSFVLAGDNMGPAKREKAQELGVRLVSENEFLEMINEKPSIVTNELLLPF